MRSTEPGHGGAAGARPASSPPGLREAASGYWHRRGLPTEPAQVAVAPDASLLLLAVLAAADDGEGRPGGGSVLLPHPCPSWYAPQARLLGRTVHTVPVPAECGGLPDPFALLETVRRVRSAGDEPRVLVLSVADEVTGTAAPPELLHEVCEAAVAEGLLLVSDETWRDTTHDAHQTVLVSPAEMLAPTGQDAHVVVLADLGRPASPSGEAGVGIARFPSAGRGRRLGERVHELLTALRPALSGTAAAAAAGALTEPAGLRDRRSAQAHATGRLARALHCAVTEAGALCRPPSLGRYVYADLDRFRPRLAARGITDAPRLEAALVGALGPYAEGGHRFGDHPRELRVRLTTDMLTTTPAATAPHAGAAPGGSRAGPVPGGSRAGPVAGRDGPADLTAGGGPPSGGSASGGGPAPGAGAGPASGAGPAAGRGRTAAAAESLARELPDAAESLAQVQSVLADLTDGSPQ
ncbi:aminotransferase class I/II-fold pyridoxal phosphate-dependent enzyme [Streptomyces albus]|uniref:aminotransferase class I/II-fold pyridoxal phosphate-dependent enzyme n=1 Tax=Streptomyces albus TaxID=1888 RepID=UPI003702C115